jgi:hypothetical protein
MLPVMRITCRRGAALLMVTSILLHSRSLVFLERRPCCCCAAGVVALLCGWINISGTVPVYYCLYTLCCVFMYLHVCCAVSVLTLCGCTYYRKTLNIYIKIGNGGVRAPRRCTQTRPMGTDWDICLLAEWSPRCDVLKRIVMPEVWNARGMPRRAVLVLNGCNLTCSGPPEASSTLEVNNRFPNFSHWVF